MHVSRRRHHTVMDNLLLAGQTGRRLTQHVLIWITCFEPDKLVGDLHCMYQAGDLQCMYQVGDRRPCSANRFEWSRKAYWCKIQMKTQEDDHLETQRLGYTRGYGKPLSTGKSTHEEQTLSRDTYYACIKCETDEWRQAANVTHHHGKSSHE
jgi:hypothetical protein